MAIKRSLSSNRREFASLPRVGFSSSKTVLNNLISEVNTAISSPVRRFISNFDFMKYSFICLLITKVTLDNIPEIPEDYCARSEGSEFDRRNARLHGHHPMRRHEPLCGRSPQLEDFRVPIYAQYRDI